MGLDAKKVLAICQQYTDDSVEGAGAIKGKPCQIQSITEITGGHRVTFVWEKNDGTEQSQTLDIMDGERGEQGIQGETGATGATGAQGIQGIQGIQGAKGDKGDKGDQGIQGVQGIQGAKGDDGYPFLIYKQYDDISEFTESDFPEVGLMFMVMQEDFDPDDPTTSIGYPIYRYTGEGNPPYSLVVHLASQGIKGDKGDKGDQGVQGIQGEKGDKGDKGDQGIQGVQGVAGADGVDGTYIVSVLKTGTQGLVDTYTITLSDDSTFTFDVTNGANGTNGADGFSPLAVVTQSGNVITISITDANGSTQESIDISDFAKKSVANTFAESNTFNKGILSKGNISLESDSSNIRIRLIDKLNAIGTAIASSVWGLMGIEFVDKNAKRGALIQPTFRTDGALDLNISVDTANNPTGNILINGAIANPTTLFTIPASGTWGQALQSISSELSKYSSYYGRILIDLGGALYYYQGQNMWTTVVEVGNEIAFYVVNMASFTVHRYQTNAGSMTFADYTQSGCSGGHIYSI